MIVSAQNHPPYGLLVSMNGVYWERSADPFHIHSFSFEMQCHIKSGADVLDTIEQEGERKAGWIAIAHDENPVGFIPDGYETKSFGYDEIFVRYNGPFDKEIAIPLDYSHERISEHIRRGMADSVIRRMADDLRKPKTPVEKNWFLRLLRGKGK